MIRSTFKHDFTVILAFILIAGCAKISSPTGGPKDKEPPVIVKSSPASGEKNFKGKKITITFDEFVALEKVNEKFMVSPPMIKKPKVYIKGKSVIIEYDEDLRDSTTYTFYFQDAIRDLNESNTIDNYQFVFSTGPVIDSLSVTGNVYKAFNLNPPEDALVMLYRDLGDSAVVRHLPDYISKASKKGYFRIDNIKEGKYRLYALKDADNSKNFNLPDEEIGFMNTPIEITAGDNYLPATKDSVKTLKPDKKVLDTAFVKGEYQLIVFKAPKKIHYFTSSSRNMPYKLIYTLSIPPDTMGFDFSIPGSGSDSYFIERSKENDTIQVWLTDSTLYSRPQISTLVSYPFTDTTGKIIHRKDTILMRFLIPRATRARVKVAPFKVSSGIFSGALRPGQQIDFRSQTPLRTPDTSMLRLYETVDSTRKRIPFSIESDNKNSCRVTLSATFRQGKKYLFIADSAAFGNIYGEHSDSTGTRFLVRNNDTFGKLILNIKNYDGPRIIQLLTSEEKIVRETIMDKDSRIEYPFLDQGKYRVRVIYDLNGDGEWTTGDYLSARQPEPVSFLPQEVDIKENWEIDLDWDISRQNFKRIKSTTIKNTGR
jgi:hypothetical protein